MKGEGYVTKLIRMTYVNPQEIVRTLTPLITKDGNLIAYPATNSLIITDSVSAIRKIEKLIAAMDVPTPTGKGKINVYYLKHASSEDIAKVMQALVSRLPVPPAGGAPQPVGPATILEGAVTITADKLTNSLIIVASPDRLRDHEGRDPEARHPAAAGLRRSGHHRDGPDQVARAGIRVPGGELQQARQRRYDRHRRHELRRHRNMR